MDDEEGPGPSQRAPHRRDCVVWEGRAFWHDGRSGQDAWQAGQRMGRQAGWDGRPSGVVCRVV